MKYKDYKHLIICISIISLWIMILFFLGNIVSSKIDILNIERNQQQEELISYYDFMAKNKNIDSYREKINFNLNLLTEKIPQEIDEEKFLLQLNLNSRLVSIQDSNIFIQNNTINAKLTLQIYANN